MFMLVALFRFNTLVGFHVSVRVFGNHGSGRVSVHSIALYNNNFNEQTSPTSLSLLNHTAYAITTKPTLKNNNKQPTQNIPAVS
ncbi:hypothetical protein [Vulcanisaeta distributa]|uniref:hypothetical protein n=1 Tax=Vulcanisaeta distributa TaxID=164451 RepID=UPI000A8BF3F9|nr:hypothetical protein [Vulcanisaeta distributa]